MVFAIGLIFIAPSQLFASVISQQTDKSTVYTIGETGFANQPLVTGTTTNLGSLTLSLNNNGCATGVFFYLAISNGMGDGPYYVHNSATPYDYNPYECDGSTGQKEVFFSTKYVAPYAGTPAGNGLALTANCGVFNSNNCPWQFTFQKNSGNGSAMKGYGKSTVSNFQDAYFIANNNFVPSDFYARIKNTSGGTINFRDDSNTSANIIKTLPEDWVVRVASTTDNNGNYITSNGFNWYKVIDPTDNSSGWIVGSDASSTVYYLPYEAQKQTVFQATSSNYIATSSRPALIIDIFDHYYNNTSTSSSLYSSDDGSNNISDLKDGGFEKKILLGIAAQESGPSPFSFNNEIVASDYGHGIMQITLAPAYPFDNRGYANTVTLPPCGLDSDDYLNCYTAADGSSPFLRHYQAYAGNSSNPTYKQYTNTEQSIYSNIKDGMEILADKFNVYSSISTSTTIDGTVYSASDRKALSATANYNGSCDYLDEVADKLDVIDTYFPTATSSDISGFIQKMHTAGNTSICAQLHSPGDLVIQDSKDHVVGMVDGRSENNFPLAIYDEDQKFIKILAAGNDNYTFKVVGTDKGAYGLDITLKNGDKDVVFRAIDIAMLPGQVHTYSLDKEALLKGKEGVTLKIDRNADGIPERTIISGAILTQDVYNTWATAEEIYASSLGHGSKKTLSPKNVKPEGSQVQTEEAPLVKEDYLDELHKIHKKND